MKKLLLLASVIFFTMLPSFAYAAEKSIQCDSFVIERTIDGKKFVHLLEKEGTSFSVTQMTGLIELEVNGEKYSSVSVTIVNGEFTCVGIPYSQIS